MKLLTLAAVLAAVALPVAAQSAQKPEASQETPSRQVEQAKPLPKAGAKLAKAQDKAKKQRKSKRDKRPVPAAPKA